MNEVSYAALAGLFMGMLFMYAITTMSEQHEETRTNKIQEHFEP